MKAFVEVTYMDDGPSFGGACAHAIARAEVIEVDANKIREAEDIALKTISKNPMAGRIRSRFLRWA